MSMSLAWQQFQSSLQMSEALLELEREKCQNPPRLQEQAVSQALRGGTAILMVAAFEFYLRELFIEMLDSLSGRVNGVSFHKLPDAMRVTSVFESLDLAIKGPRHGPTKDKKDRIADIESCCKRIIAGNLDPDAFADTGSNPNAEVVRKLFKNVGLPDIFGKAKSSFEATTRWGSPVADTFISDKLNEIVRRRNVVAHTANTLNLTRSELKASIKFLRCLGEVLDKLLSEHVETIKNAP